MTKKKMTEAKEQPDDSDVRITHGKFAGMTVAQARKTLASNKVRNLKR
jgi:hypothetical protein